MSIYSFLRQTSSHHPLLGEPALLSARPQCAVLFPGPEPVRYNPVGFTARMRTSVSGQRGELGTATELWTQPLPGQTGHFHFAFQQLPSKAGRTSSRRRLGKEPVSVSNEGKECDRDSSLPTACGCHKPFTGLDGSERPGKQLLWGRVTTDRHPMLRLHHHRHHCYRHHLSWSTCPKSRSRKWGLTVPEASCPLSRIPHTYGLTLSALSGFSKGLHFGMSKENLN